MPIKFLMQTSHTGSKIPYKPQDKRTLQASIYLLVAELL